MDIEALRTEAMREADRRFDEIQKLWRNADYSWEGLALKGYDDEERTLQDYWGDLADDLRKADDGKLYTLVHFPLLNEDGSQTGKENWPEEDWDRIRSAFNARADVATKDGQDIDLSGVMIAPGMATIRFLGDDEYSATDYMIRADHAVLPGIRAEQARLGTIRLSRCVINKFEISDLEAERISLADTISSGAVAIRSVKMTEFWCGNAAFLGPFGFWQSYVREFSNIISTKFFGPVTFYSATHERSAYFAKIDFFTSAFFQSFKALAECTFSDVRFERRPSFESAEIRGLLQFVNISWPRDVHYTNQNFFNAELQGNVVIRDKNFFYFSIFNGASIIRDVILPDAVVFEDGAFNRAIARACDKDQAARKWLLDLQVAASDARSEDELLWRPLPLQRRYAAGSGGRNASRNKLKLPLQVSRLVTRFAKKTDLQTASDDASRGEAKPKPDKNYFETFRSDRLRELEGGLRALRKGAENAGDVARAQRFFRMELIARRRRRNSMRGAIWAASFLYQWFSDFGGSMMRPILTLIGLWVAGAGVFALWADSNFDFVGALNFSGQNIVRPFSVWAPQDLIEGTFTAQILNDPDTWRGVAIRFVATLQSFAGLILLFLFGLAARRQFQARD